VSPTSGGISLEMMVATDKTPATAAFSISDKATSPLPPGRTIRRADHAVGGEPVGYDKNHRAGGRVSRGESAGTQCRGLGTERIFGSYCLPGLVKINHATDRLIFLWFFSPSQCGEISW